MFCVCPLASFSLAGLDSTDEQPDLPRRPSAAELLRYPCLQSEIEKQLNDKRSKLDKERNRNIDLVEEVSALIQKQSLQRSGRLSRTITWDSECRSWFSRRFALSG